MDVVHTTAIKTLKNDIDIKIRLSNIKIRLSNIKIRLSNIKIRLSNIKIEIFNITNDVLASSFSYNKPKTPAARFKCVQITYKRPFIC